MDSTEKQSPAAADKYTKKKKRVPFMLVLLLVLAAAGAGYAAYYVYNESNFVTTDNASLQADRITISPPQTGSLSKWSVSEGDEVTKNQALGYISQSVSSASVNAQKLAQSDSTEAAIKTPIDGKVVKSYAVVGEAVAPGMSLAIVADTKNTYIQANIEETEIMKIKTGQYVSIKIDAYPDVPFYGYVASIGQATQNAFSLMQGMTTSGTFSKTVQYVPVKITVVNEENLSFIIGMNAVVKIHLTDLE